MRILYTILWVCLLISEFSANAQTSTSSPYSMYGIGDLAQIGFGQNRALGGAGIALPTATTINIVNPASYLTIDSLSFLTDIGFNVKNSRFTSNSQTQTGNSAGFGYLAIGFRNTSWWKNSIGLIPFSSVGYNINTKKNIEGTSDLANVNVQGSGGLNQFYWGNAFKIFPNLSLGANLAFIFGSTTQTQDITTSSNYISGDLKSIDNTYMHRLYLSYGAQYYFKLSKNVKGSLGLIYGGPCKLNLYHDISTIDNVTSSNNVLQDNVTTENSLTLPAYYGLGWSIKLFDKLMVTSDYKFYNWSGSQSLQSNVRFSNSNNYLFGAEYTPSTSFRDRGWKKVSYRVGGFINDSYLIIQNQQMKDRGVTFGFGLPLMQKKININFACQIGQKGVSTGQGIITENYTTFNINFTLFDFWFFKPKFD